MKNLISVICFVLCAAGCAGTAAMADGSPAVPVSVRSTDGIEAGGLQGVKDILVDNLDNRNCQLRDYAPCTLYCTIIGVEQPASKAKLLWAPVYPVYPYPTIYQDRVPVNF